MKVKIPITHYEYMFDNALSKIGIDIDKIIEMVPEGFDFQDWKYCVENEDRFKYMPFFAVDNQQLNMTVRMIYHISRLKIYGEKIYHFSKETCDIIFNTKPTIDAEFIESPFEEIYLSLDQTKLVLQEGNDTLPVKGIYISLRRERDGIKKLRFLATSGVEGIGELKDINHFAVFNIPEHGDLETIFEEQMSRFVRGFGESKVKEEIIHDIFKFSVGCLLYIGCKNVNLYHIKPMTVEQAIKGLGVKKSKIIARRMSKSAKSPYIYVSHGSHISDGKNKGTGKKLDHEVLVGGYWRGQWYGSDKNGDRRKSIIRISSYIKGKGGERENKKYIVK